MKLTDYLNQLAEKAGKKLEEIGDKIEKKVEEVDEKFGQKLEDKVEGVKQTWNNLDDAAKKDIKKGTAVATGTGIVFGGIPAIAGLIYATKKFMEAYNREQSTSKTRIFNEEEKLKLEKLGLEAYVTNIKENKDVYGDIPREELNEIQNLVAEIGVAGLKRSHPLRKDAEKNMYTLGASYRNKIIKNSSYGEK